MRVVCVFASLGLYATWASPALTMRGRTAPPPPQAACGDTCSSDDDCLGSGCPCYGGYCSAPPPLAPPPPPPPAACGDKCSSDDDCLGSGCPCYGGYCSAPAPLAPPPPPPPPPPPLPPAPCGNNCTRDNDCYGQCDACTGGMCLPASLVKAHTGQRGGNATVTGCKGVEPATVLRGVASRLLSHPEKLFDWDVISAQYGSGVVEVRVMEGAANKPPFPMRKMLMQEFLQATVLLPPGKTERTGLYVQQLDIFSYLPGLAAAAGVPRDGAGSLCATLPETRFAGYFVSSAGVTTPLHVDNGDVSGPRTLRKSSANFFVQLSGTKRFVLIPPSVPLTYLHPSDGEPWPHVSRAHEAVPGCRADEGAMSAWPGLSEAWAQRIELILGPGDGVLVPSWWWHCTEALEDGAAVNWWFDEAPCTIDPVVV